MNLMKRIAFSLGAISLPGLAFAVEINLAEQLAEGGAALLVTLGLSILFLAVTIERLIHLRARAVVPGDLAERIQPLWAAHRFDEIEQMLADDRSALARVIAFLVAHRQQPYAVVSGAAGDIASMELRKHQQKAYALAIVATVAPIVGLLGTVLGMIDSFHVIAYAEGMGNPALLAGGISKALVNTAAGLTVALPALGMHHYFKHRLATLGLALEQQVNALINQRFLPQPEAPVLRVVQHAH
ncbi:biopolymer transport protein ExbB [Pelomonas saccharophila]|uniref:Biopolymer transport protein ExbB n=1 Tax=Roseateles saccharophilus TaxID=304 RepID=A0ABU1YRP5_ROSSA|nr:MotA/TolQ/ExbB proton channel family protein [Roseateles saccharophilus]MDR7271519.1 biopolymer transport protein ExbB [Roseateles saccharophilus]